MNESHPCPQCGEVLDVPAALAADPVRCGACGKVFTPREAMSAASFDAEPLPRRRRQETLEPTASNSTRRVVFIVMALLGLISLVCCGGFAYLVHTMMNPDWQDYRNPEMQFVIKFPQGSVSAAQQTTGRGGEVAKGVAARRTLLQEEYFVYAVPEKGFKKTETQLKDLAKGLKQQWPAAVEVHEPRLRAHEGHEAMDLCFQQADERFTQIRLVMANGQIYIVGMTGPGEPDGKAWVDEYLDSFEPLQKK